MHFRKTTVIGLILLLVGAGAVVLAKPERRTLQSYDHRLEVLKSKLNEVEASKTDALQALDESDREAVKSLDEFLKTYQTPEKYRFSTMKKLAILVLSSEPVVNHLVAASRSALPAPKGDLAMSTMPPSTDKSAATTPAPAPSASAPPKPAFKIADDEGC